MRLAVLVLAQTYKIGSNQRYWPITSHITTSTFTIELAESVTKAVFKEKYINIIVLLQRDFNSYKEHLEWVLISWLWADYGISSSLGMMLYLKLLCSKTEMMLWCCRFTNKSCVKRELAFLLSAPVDIYFPGALLIPLHVLRSCPPTFSCQKMDWYVIIIILAHRAILLYMLKNFFFVEWGWVYPCEISFALYMKRLIPT